MSRKFHPGRTHALACLILASLAAGSAAGDHHRPQPRGNAEPAQLRMMPGRKPDDAPLLLAYTLLQAGDLLAARAAYQEALRRFPASADALLGMASVARHLGQNGEAERYLRQALEADPLHDAALAAAIAALAAVDPLAAESRLNNLLAATPDSAPLRFQLGNLHAHRQRWAEARLAYAAAAGADGDMPDYHFNLAVSLEHLHEARAASHQYRLALAAAAHRSPGFQREEARRRWLALAGGEEK